MLMLVYSAVRAEETYMYKGYKKRAVPQSLFNEMSREAGNYTMTPHIRKCFLAHARLLVLPRVFLCSYICAFLYVYITVRTRFSFFF